MDEKNGKITVVTWNINGIRSLYKKSSEIKTGLDALQADVICFQETKVSKSALEESVAIVEGYNSYFEFPRNKNGYSGVATYCKDDFAPFKAEGSLTGVYYREKKDRGLLSRAEESTTVGCYNYIDDTHNRYVQKLLDSEGRAVITQHKFVVPFTKEERDLAIINLYAPRADIDDRMRYAFKLMFYELLEKRIQALLESGSHVMVVGDLNTARKPIDHCDPGDLEQFNAEMCRRYLNHLIWDPNKSDIPDPNFGEACFQLFDAFRYVNPSKEDAFTCWSTQHSSRVLNFGTRIDYILVDEGLKPWIEDCRILSDIYGSDHCPVKIILNLNGLCSKNLPSFCTKFYQSFSGKQKKLFDFYKKTDTNVTASQLMSEHKNTYPDGETKRKPSPKRTETKRQKGIEGFIIKKSVMGESVSASRSLATFYGSETASSPSHHERCSITTGKRECICVKCTCKPSVSNVERVPALRGEDTQGLTSLKPTAAQIWKEMFTGPKPPPNCTGHNQPCVQKCVKKKGPNFNRKFWVCARGAGHRHDPRSRCDFFIWDSEM